MDSAPDSISSGSLSKSKSKSIFSKPYTAEFSPAADMQPFGIPIPISISISIIPMVANQPWLFRISDFVAPGFTAFGPGLATQLRPGDTRIGVGVGVGIGVEKFPEQGIDPDPDSDPDRDEKRTGRNEFWNLLSDKIPDRSNPVEDPGRTADS